MTTKLLPACLAVLAACSDSSQPPAPDGGSVLTPSYEWSYHFRGTDEATPNAVAIGQDGAAYLSGSFKGTDDFGKGPLTSVGYHDIYFAKYDASRTALFAKRFGSTGSSALAAMAQDRDGNLYLVGSTASGTDFGGGGLPEGNFVASFAPSGAHRFSAPLGKGGTITSFAVDGAGNLYLCGSFPDTINLGGDPLTSAGALDLFLASYTATGAHRFSKPLGGSVNEENCRIAVDAAGNIFLAGDTWGTTNLGGKDLTSAGYSDILLASFTPSGDHRFSKRFGSDRPDSAGGLLVDAGGNLYLTGDFGNTISFGGGSC